MMNTPDKLKVLNFFYGYPLYDYATNGIIEVTIFSQNQVYEDLLATILETGQISRTRLVVTIFSKSADLDKNYFLEKWPGLNKFFDIDSDTISSNLDSYGRINFINYANLDEVDEYIASHKSFRYCLVHLGDNSLEYVKKIKEHNSLFSETNVVAYFQDQKIYLLNKENVLVEYDNEGITLLIDRFAFNAHLVWLPRFRGKTLEEVHDGFVIKSNNYNSSYALALSFKYKLHVLGLSLDNPVEAADKLVPVLKQNSKAVVELAYMEHRRWTVNQLTLGNEAPQGEGINKYNYIFDNNNFSSEDYNRQKCGKLNIHSCIVHSRPEIGLKDNFDWDNGDVSALDELDKMSVEIHRAYKRHSDEYWKNNDINEDTDYLKIQKCLSPSVNPLSESIKNVGFSGAEKPMSELRSNDIVKFEFEKYKMVLFGALNHSRAHARKYFDSYNQLVVFLKKNYHELYAKIHGNLDSLNLKLLSTVKAYSYEDFKKKDFDIIYTLPFILTFDYRNKIGMPFVITDYKDRIKDTIYGNVAPIAMLKPSEVFYIVDITEKNKQYAPDMIESCTRYLKDNYNTSINLLLFVKGKSNELQILMEKLTKKSCINKYEMFDKEVIGKVEDKTTDYLMENEVDYYDFSNTTFADQFSNGAFITMVRDIFRGYYFDITSNPQFYGFSNPDLTHPDARLKFVHLVQCLGKDYISFNELIPLVDKDAWVATPGFICEEEVTYLWNNLIKGKSNSDILKYNSFSFGVVNQKITKSEETGLMWLLLSSKEAVDYKSIIDVIVRGGYAKIKNENDKVILTFYNNNILNLLRKAGDLFERYCYYSCIKLGYFDEVISGAVFRYYHNKVSNELDLVLVKGFKTIIMECKQVANTMGVNLIRSLEHVCNFFGANTIGVFGSVVKVSNISGTRSAANHIQIEFLDDLRNKDIALSLKELMENK